MTSKMIFTLVITMTAMLELVSSAAPNRPSFYTGCQSNEECMPGYCCSMSPYKYTVPTCNPMRQEGEACRPTGLETMNTTLSYPDGSQVEVTNVYYIMCPCSSDLTCDLSEATCKDPTRIERLNEIQSEFDI